MVSLYMDSWIWITKANELEKAAKWISKLSKDYGVYSREREGEENRMRNWTLGGKNFQTCRQK